MDRDVVIVGGGHNGLTAAAYLARAGLRVTVLERLDHTGGAAVSAPAFSGHGTRLSRYSYLVSLLSSSIVDELGLDIRLESRRTASYTPLLRDGVALGLLAEHEESDATRASFREITGSDDAYDAWLAFYDDVADLAAVGAPTLTGPLPRESAVSGMVTPRIWRDFVTTPLGAAIERRFTDDTVRGVVATDALIGTFASLNDPSLIQNRCFLYHLIGNGTGEWRVPVGGMGAVTDALLKAARDAGAEIITDAEVTSIEPGEPPTVHWVSGGRAASEASVSRPRWVLSGVAPWTLASLMGEDPGDKPSGSQLKINVLLDELPRLKSGMNPEVAFAGTLHLEESYEQLETAYAEAASGQLPSVLPGEVYCHSLTDPSILGPDDAGRHTLTYFGIHTPARLFDDPENIRLAKQRALESIDRHLVKPLKKHMARDADDKRCIEVKTPLDIERDLAMPGGHIFHGDLEWPWAPDRAILDDPADRWGVATGVPGVLLSGSGARRGGAVSGLGGHNAAQAVLELS